MAIPLLESAGYQVTASYDLNLLTALTGRFDLVLLYTCLGSKAKPGQEADPTLNEAQAGALIAWVRAGGALLALHAATAFGQTSAALHSLLGGTFLNHPAPFSFTVAPLNQPHPVIAGVEAFTVKDELYNQDVDPAVQVHMVTVDRGIAYPMVWTKPEGQGQVVHIAPGHGPETWNHPAFQTLTLQAAAWLTTPQGNG